MNTQGMFIYNQTYYRQGRVQPGSNTGESKCVSVSMCGGPGWRSYCGYAEGSEEKINRVEIP